MANVAGRHPPLPRQGPPVWLTLARSSLTCQSKMVATVKTRYWISRRTRNSLMTGQYAPTTTSRQAQHAGGLDPRVAAHMVWIRSLGRDANLHFPMWIRLPTSATGHRCGRPEQCRSDGSRWLRYARERRRQVRVEAGGPTGDRAGREGGVVVLRELDQVVEVGVAVVGEVGVKPRAGAVGHVVVLRQSHEVVEVDEAVQVRVAGQGEAHEERGAVDGLAAEVAAGGGEGLGGFGVAERVGGVAGECGVDARAVPRTA